MIENQQTDLFGKYKYNVGILALLSVFLFPIKIIMYILAFFDYYILFLDIFISLILLISVSLLMFYVHVTKVRYVEFKSPRIYVFYLVLCILLFTSCFI
jgi:hypothetical protein